MDSRVAVISIIANDEANILMLNKLLHDYRDYIIGRMGIPYKQKGIYIISIAVDAPQDLISALAGKLGRIDGITTKTTYSKY